MNLSIYLISYGTVIFLIINQPTIFFGRRRPKSFIFGMPHGYGCRKCHRGEAMRRDIDAATELIDAQAITGTETGILPPARVPAAVQCHVCRDHASSKRSCSRACGCGLVAALLRHHGRARSSLAVWSACTRRHAENARDTCWLSRRAERHLTPMPTSWTVNKHITTCRLVVVHQSRSGVLKPNYSFAVCPCPIKPWLCVP